MGVPLNVIDYRCFWKAVSAMQKAEYQVNSTIIESYSAGTETKPQINQDAVRIMKEIYGIDMEVNGWGKSTVKALLEYILNRESGIRGYSSQNIWRRKRFMKHIRTGQSFQRC